MLVHVSRVLITVRMSLRCRLPSNLGHYTRRAMLDQGEDKRSLQRAQRQCGGRERLLRENPGAGRPCLARSFSTKRGTDLETDDCIGDARIRERMG